MHGRSELLAQATRAYRRFLLSIVDGSAFFPLTIRTGKSNRSASYPTLKTELAEFRVAADALGLQVEWRDVNVLRFGSVPMPEQASFVDEASYLKAIGKVEEARRFCADLALIREALPEPDQWVRQNVQAVLDHHGLWRELLRVVKWFQEHPQPKIYLRQVPVEGVDTKFFEKHEKILDSLVTHAQPGLVVSVADKFAERHGLLWAEIRIRFRFLDPALQRKEGFPVSDVSIPVSDFRALEIAPPVVVVTENLKNFLALPPMEGTVAVFGRGNAALVLAGTAWMQRSRLLYWGDIDPDGYAILSRFRAEFPQTESILMDEATLDAHRRLAVPIPPANLRLPPYLTDEERDAFEKVVAARLRLEQERIPFAVVLEALSLF